jgi:hypothetical protein
MPTLKRGFFFEGRIIKISLMSSALKQKNDIVGILDLFLTFPPMRITESNSSPQGGHLKMAQNPGKHLISGVFTCASGMYISYRVQVPNTLYSREY